LLKTILKYAAALLVFIVTYGIFSAIGRFAAAAMDPSESGIWNYVVPSLCGFVAGYFTALVSLSVVDRQIPAVLQRTVALIFIGLWGVMWGTLLAGLYLDGLGGIALPLGPHVLWSPDVLPELFQSAVAMFAAWKWTEETPRISCHSNGRISSEGAWRNGHRQDGPWVTYHENGELESKGNLLNGKLHGNWVFFEWDGTVILERTPLSGFVNEGTGTYKNGRKEKWMPGGNKAFDEVMYRAHIKQGPDFLDELFPD
jgi:hypothetical protein